MQQHIVVVDQCEHVHLMLRGDDVHRMKRRVAQLLESGDVDQTHEHAQIERAIDEIGLVGPDLELILQQLEQLRRCRPLDLEANDVAAAAAPQLALDELQLCPSAFVVHFELSVPRHAEHR